MTPARLFLAAFAFGCVLSGVALASDVHRWNAETYVQITASNAPGAVAEVTFHNEIAQTMMLEFFDLTHDGITVAIRIDARQGDVPDTMTVTPPLGFIAVPESITVDEGGAGVIHIYEEGMS
jgi:hypothetical protein